MTEDPQWTAFLQWVLPQLRMRWPGFRKVRTQVRKRAHRRMQSLQLDGLNDYRDYLQQHPDEWRVLDTLCRITISRFYRDKGIYRLLADRLIPGLVEQIRREGRSQLHIWSAGCGSGEEPYSLAILWAMQLQQRFPDITLRILATDIEPHLLNRARTACYPFSSLKELPAAWRESAFTASDGRYCLQETFKRQVLFVEHDVRCPVPATSLQLILCRNLVYTYYDEGLQREITQRLVDALQPGGLLVVGSHETLPDNIPVFTPLSCNRAIYKKPV
ncbi:MAG: chemotaxis protein CheR [Gammaproteobacteria bacterium]|nr:chemotaxis protein CheR [Gammaproteobacteria bacterium]